MVHLGAGKDLFGGLVYKSLHENGWVETFMQSFKEQLVEIAIVIANVDMATWTKWYVEKEAPRNELWGLSCRQFLIKISEDVIKPNFDKQYFGKTLTKKLLYGVNIVTDGGFYEEIEPIVEDIGAENILVIRLHREGCDYSGDSRGWIKDEWFEGVQAIDVQSGEHQQTLNSIMPYVVNFLKNNR